jgi:hypothetical protein
LKGVRSLWRNIYTQLRHIGIRLALLCLDERTQNGLINVVGLRCGLRPKRSGDLEQSLSDIFPVYRLDQDSGSNRKRKFAMLATPNEKKYIGWFLDAGSAGDSEKARDAFEKAAS